MTRPFVAYTALDRKACQKFTVQVKDPTPKTERRFDRWSKKAVRLKYAY